jgi:hypothetical protein
MVGDVEALLNLRKMKFHWIFSTLGLAHLRTPKLKTYLVGKLVELIWQEDIDNEYFMDSSTIIKRNLKMNDSICNSFIVVMDICN